MDGFIFPDDLQAHMAEQLQAARTEYDTLRVDTGGVFAGRISDARFRGANGLSLSFRLDGKPVTGVVLSAWQKSMLDLGLVTVYQLAVHFCMHSGHGFSQQRRLF